MNMESAPEAPQELASQIRTLWKEAKVHLGVVEFINRQVAFAAELRKKYPDFMKRRAYHVFVGSTIHEQPGIIEEDFPGDDSVIQFLESLAKE